MKVGIDLRPLQNGHKFRGIGEVTKQVTDRIVQLGRRDGVEFIFYCYEDSDPTKLLNLSEKNYSIIKLGRMPEGESNQFTRKQKIGRAYKLLYGEPIPESAASDVFLQFDYGAGVPRNTKTILIKHDLIPYVFWNQYFESAWVPFKNKALRTTLRTLFANYKFMRQLRRGLNDARVIMTVSESTKKDIHKHFSVSEAKTKVAHLGVDLKPAKTDSVNNNEINPTKPYLLFIGAGDARRRVDDLVAAFNNLKASGKDIQLVLAGENFQSPEHIPNVLVRREVLQSSYKKDILTLGYISDEQKQRLFKNAIAYVYPTKYEGFGIPVLEAMLLECPVITYKNSSIPEVAGDNVFFANNWQDIVTQVSVLLKQSEEEKIALKKRALKHAQKFTWDKTSEVIYSEIQQLSKR